MYKRQTISVILPCFNEEKGLAKVIADMPKYVDEIVVVDNNSTDHTASVAKKAGAVVVKESLQGYGSALRAGINKASSNLIITMDGDGTYPTHFISNLIEVLITKKVDFVSGNRFNKKYQNSLPFLNLIGNKILTLATNLLYGKKILDSQSGMMLFRRQITPHLKMECNGMNFSEEIKINAIINPDIKFAEYPIPYNNRDRLGERKLRLWHDGFENLYYLFAKKFKI